MADIAPQQPAGDPSQGGDPSQAPPPANPVQQAQQQFLDQPAQGGQDGHPTGTVGQQQQQQDPSQQAQATPAEQAQYIQLVTRFVLMVHDMRKHADGADSGMQAAIRAMNNPKLTIPQAVGYATAQTMFIIEQSAKVQKVQFDPDVMFHAADECIVAMYLLGSARGIFKGAPPFKGLNPNNPNGYDFEPGELHIIAQAKVYAVQKFGQLMQSHGQITEQMRKEASDFWMQQIKKEVDEGKVDPAVIQALQKNPQMQSQMGGDAGNASAAPDPNAADPSQQGGVAPQQPSAPAGAPQQ